MQVFPYDVCRRTYQDMPAKIDDDMHICAGTWEGGKDGCASDSGTPLFVGDQATGYKVVGITVDGEGCGRPGVPAYYTRISHQAKWIEEAVCLLSDRPPEHCERMEILWKLPVPTSAPTSRSPTTARPTTGRPTRTFHPTPAPTRYPTRMPTPTRPSRHDWTVDLVSFMACLLVAGTVGYLWVT